PVRVVLQRPEWPARGITEVGPERGVRVGRHLVVAETLTGDQGCDLGPVDLVVESLSRGKQGWPDRVELCQHRFPVALAGELCSRIDPGQMVGNRLLRILASGELLLAPLPLRRVERSQLLIRIVPAGSAGTEPDRP